MIPTKRVIFSFISNLIKAIFSLATGLLIARGLGPEDFGILSFLLASFTALRSMLDMGTSSAFFSFISKKLQSKKFFITYLVWLMIQFILSLLFIGLFAPNDWIANIWQGEFRERVLLAFVAIFFQQQIWGMLSNVGESQRMTVRVQSINIFIAIFHLLIILGLYSYDALSIERIFILIIIEIFLAGIIAWWTFGITYSHEAKTLQQIIQEFKKFCLPLLPYTYLGIVMGFADTWLLQHFGGAVEQAYYGIGFRFAAVSLIATQSVLKIFWKEIAESNELNDKERVRRIYDRTNRTLFMLGAIISGFLVPWASEIIQLMLGDAYKGGVFVLSIMFLYPIHQSLGQVNGTMYYALELTKPYAIIGMVFMTLSIIAVYFLLAPANAIIQGFGLASTGLAIKMVFMQIFGVNLSIWWLSRSQGWKFSIIYQFIGIGSFLAAGFLAKESIAFFIWNGAPQLFQLTLTGLVYIIVSGAIIYTMPWLLNMKRNEIKGHILSVYRSV